MGKIKDMVAEAIKKLEAGDLDGAKALRKQAKEMKALKSLDKKKKDDKPATTTADGAVETTVTAPAGAPATAAAAKTAPVVYRLPFGQPTQTVSGDGAEVVSAGHESAIKAWSIKQFGHSLNTDMDQISTELYGADYAHVAWAKHADFKRYLRSGSYDPRLSKLLLLSPDQIGDVAMHGISLAEVKATMLEGQDVLGGYLVPEDYRQMLVKRLPGLTVVRPYANVITTSSDRVLFPKATGGDRRYTSNVRGTWVDESPTAGAAATNATWGQVAVPVHTLMCKVPLSRNLLEDAGFGMQIDSYLADLFAKALAIVEDEAFLVGNGIAKPQGVLKNATTGGAADPDTNSVNGGAAALTADTLVDTPMNLDVQYRQSPSCIWVMARGTVSKARQLKDGQGRYLWADNIQNMQAANNQALLGFPVKESEAMPAIASGNFPIVFGDFAGYYIADRIGLAVERYIDSTTADTNSVIFYARRRLGGQVGEGWRFVTYKTT